MKPTKSDRGLTHIEFKDGYDKPCILSKSSSAEEDAIWLGINQSGHRMHLTREQVKELLPYLKRFVKTGEFHHDPILFHRWTIKRFSTNV